MPQTPAADDLNSWDRAMATTEPTIEKGNQAKPKSAKECPLYPLFPPWAATVAQPRKASRRVPSMLRDPFKDSSLLRWQVQWRREERGDRPG